MKALITGASSGIGYEMAVHLSKMGYDLIIVARREQKLNDLKEKLKTNAKVVSLDVSIEDNCYKLFEENKDIDVLINNAGFGVFGNFYETDLKRELEMIDTNIKAVHILTKLYLKQFKINNKGYILNVASSAAFAVGPLMATYYASKSYVYRLSEAIYHELKAENINVHISVLCPGPVVTEFNDVANVKFGIKPLGASYVAKYAIEKMFKGRLIIIPGMKMKMNYLLLPIVPERLKARIAYKIQKRKDLSRM